MLCEMVVVLISVLTSELGLAGIECLLPIIERFLSLKFCLVLI